MFGRKLHCSFCGKDETQVAKLVAGPKVYICEACVRTAQRIMDTSDGNDASIPKLSPWRRLLGRLLQAVSRSDVQRRVQAGAL